MGLGRRCGGREREDCWLARGLGSAAVRGSGRADGRTGAGGFVAVVLCLAVGRTGT